MLTKSSVTRWSNGKVVAVAFALGTSYLLACLKSMSLGAQPDPSTHDGGRKLLWNEKNCTEASILDFPTFPGGLGPTLVLCFLVLLYLFRCLTIICEGYFVGCIRIMADRMDLGREVAGSTIMAMGVSCPDFFINLIGTFVTEGDIGVGMVVGCSLVNLTAIPGLCAVLVSSIPLDPWSLSRDCLVYHLSLILLAVFLSDSTVTSLEASVLVGLYVLYLLVLICDKPIKRLIERCSSRPDERSPLLTKRASNINISYSEGSISEDEAEQEPEGNLGKCVETFLDLIDFPVELLLKFTLPDCRRESNEKYYMITFTMCLVYIGMISYLVAWVISVAGYLLQIPDSLMGLTFIAVGMSVPQVTSSIIVARQGDGCMAISNSLGSNTFDILVCLGFPWLIKTLVTGEPLTIISHGIMYSSMLLITVITTFYACIAFNSFILGRKIGIVFILMYFLFTILAILVELNFFFEGNLPLCPLALVST